MNIIISVIKSILEPIAGIVAIFLPLILTMKLQSKSSIENKTKDYDYVKSMILDAKENEVAAIYGLKRYVEKSLDDDLAKYILKSTQFYELTTIIKDFDELFEFDKGSRKYIARKKIRLLPSTIGYFGFSLPVIFIISYSERIIDSLGLKSLIYILPILIYSFGMMLFYAKEYIHKKRVKKIIIKT